MAASKQLIDGHQQSEIWQTDLQKVVYAHLCNAFYQREVQRLVAEPSPERLRRQLKSLPFYIERAASLVVNGGSPLELDAQNGTWLAKQKPTVPQSEPQTNYAFFSVYAKVGLIIPVLINAYGLVKIKLDCVDQIADNQIHCNELGWFDYQGISLEQQPFFALKPNKSLMAAGCCGHQWQHTKRCSPRVLSLREMLLATNINWRNLKQTLV
ncbi:hypothetical protein J8L70_01795 [Pseudoalteromonas sp. MMG010]|uniref:hypothetical protein n=1 Tax=Pseudoalteromonas sp. MMG010 TaxID=2822685 RepID=UPI001B3A38C1|nr:hypothetical protein [Pseudoalteromonas sp. MMG010]MBQ4831964.1 hypothetical protein [Pseudoalteromonas sp. MMG010]